MFIIFSYSSQIFVYIRGIYAGRTKLTAITFAGSVKFQPMIAVASGTVDLTVRKGASWDLSELDVGAVARPLGGRR